MNAIRLFFVIFIIPTFLYSNEAESRFSIMLNGNYGTNWGISDAMQGSSDDLSLICQKMYNNKSFPLVMMMQVR